ncbi:MAG: stalk domain-containing protein, partial [Halothiobacillaceae bacterium]
APGDVWTITSYEKWTEAGFVQVFAPQEKTGPIGTKVTLPFVVTTFGQGGGEEQPAFRAPLAPTPVILDLSVASSLGWPVSLPQGSSVSVISGESATVNVEVMVPWTAHIGDRSSITLTASSRGEQASTGSDSTVVEAVASTAADVIPPTIILPAIEPRVNHSSLDLTLDVRDNSGQAKVTITDNGQVLVDPYQNGLLTYYLDLFEGTNDMEVIARDGAGNTSRARFTIVVDTHAPEVALDPVPLSVSTSAITLSGAVSDRTSGLRSLMVNGTPVVPYADGHFTQTIQLVRGTNTILLEATDAVGNVGKTTLNVTYATPRVQGSVTIDLTVGKTGMIVGGIPQATDSAAVIRNGRTLLPVRSFIEAFGGSVQWNAKAGVTTVRLGGRTLQLTIGSNQAVLDGKAVAIDPSNAAVVPVIVDGRTFLPVRFVADSLGISVAWDAASQTVSLTYWP